MTGKSSRNVNVAKGRRLDPLLRRYLESLLAAPFTFFEVLACDPGTGMTLRDVMTHEEHVVTERSASQGMRTGDLLFGQLASVDRLTMLEASNGFAIPPHGESPDHQTSGSYCICEPGDHPSSTTGLGF